MKPYQSESLTWTLRAGDTWYPSVHFGLRGRRMVFGRVTDQATGAPLRLANVSVDETPVAVRTDKHGAYRLTDIPRGHRQLSAARAGFLQESFGVVVAGSESLRVDFTLIDTFRPRELICAVRNALTGEALIRAAISIPGTSWRAAPTRDSLYRLHGINWHPAEILTQAQGYQATSLEPGQLLAKSTKLTIPMTPTGWTGVYGVALDAKTSEPLVGATITVSAGDSVVARCAAGKDGMFALPNLKPGRYRLTCSYMGYNDARWDVGAQAGKAWVLLLRLQPTCA